MVLADHNSSFDSNSSFYGKGANTITTVTTTLTTNSSSEHPPVSTSTPSQKSDYDVLNQEVLEHRKALQKSRFNLGTSLHNLGEHHVRNRDYVEAMNVFNEALHEKMAACGILQQKDRLTFHKGTLYANVDDRDPNDIEQVVSTLSSIGNLYSMRGEHTKATKCYTEIMTLRASHSNISHEASYSLQSPMSGSECSTENSSADASLSDSNDVNEDVQALDDLFRSISFRNGNTKRKVEHYEAPSTGSSNGERERKPTFSPITTPQEEREDYGLDTVNDIRQTSTPQDLRDNSAAVNDISIEDALAAYKHLLLTYTGHDFDQHKADYEKIVQEVKSLADDGQCDNRPEDRGNGGHSAREKSLYMTLIIYDRILSAQQQILLQCSSDMETDDRHASMNTPNEAQQASIDIASTMITIGGLHYKLSNLKEELHMYKQALSHYSKALGENHSFVAGTRKNIGMVLAERSEFEEAMEQFFKAKQIYANINCGSDMCSDVANALSCIGNVQNRRGDLDSALSSYSKALHIHRSLAEEMGWSPLAVHNVTSILKIIGMVYARRLDLDSAMKCFQEAMRLLRSQDGNGDAYNGVGVASILTRIGGIFYKKQQYKDAMLRYQEAYSVASKALGTTIHPDIAGILHYIGVVHQKRLNYGEAMVYYKESVHIYRTSLGHDNPAVALTLVCIGSIYFRQKKLDDAMMSYKEALRLYDYAYGKNHPQVCPTLKSIAMIHTRKGEYDEAMCIFQEILRMKCVQYGSSHPEIAYAYKCIGHIHLKQEEFDEALKQYQHALEIYQRTYGDDHPDVRTIVHHINVTEEELLKEKRHSNRREWYRGRFN